MQRSLLIAAVIIAAVLWMKYYSREPVAPPQREEIVDNQPAEPQPKPTAKPTAPKVVNAPLPAPVSNRKVPPKGSLPFELKDGLVVAFGDVLLGRPSSPDFPDSGFIEAPKLYPWPTKEIAYSVHPDLPNPERVTRAIEYFNANTPVRFVPLSNQTDSIVFSPTTIPLCLSYVGKIGGHQPIFLDDRCSEKEILHEIMHALGFIHEHSRPDRDQFVRVLWDKIEEDKLGQYEPAIPAMKGPHIGRPFDYNSVMIYENTAFAKVRGEVTMQSTTGQGIAPAPEGLSEEDHARLLILFSH